MVSDVALRCLKMTPPLGGSTCRGLRVSGGKQKISPDLRAAQIIPTRPGKDRLLNSVQFYRDLKYLELKLVNVHTQATVTGKSVHHIPCDSDYLSSS